MNNLGGKLVNFAKLEYAQPALARVIREKTRYYRDGNYIVDLDGLDDPILAQTLKLWVERQMDAMPDPPPPPSKPTPTPAEPQFTMEDALKEQQQDIDARGARAELDRLVAEEFLEPTDKNLSLIRHHVNTHSSGYFSATTVNQAYLALGPQGSNRLNFTEPPSAPPSTPPTPPAEQLEPWQLRLDATEREMKAAPVKALYDLQRRRREKSGQNFRDNSARYKNNFGSRF